MKTLDGSTGEGGGQILRTALFLSTLTQEPIEVVKIRQGRPKPGLKAQHVSILELLSAVCGATAKGGTLGSTSVQFLPAWPRPGNYRFDVGTAGCVPLVLQTLLPVCLLSPGTIELELVGGTDVRGGPTIEWIRHVLAPRLAPLAKRLEVAVVRHGFEPAGGGVVRLRIEPNQRFDSLGAVRSAVSANPSSGPIEAGPARAFEGVSVAHAFLADAKVAERQSAGAREFLQNKDLPAPNVESRNVEAASPGSSITLWMEDTLGRRIGADALGRRGTPAEAVGRRAAMALHEDWASGATVDRHLADHLAPWVALGLGAVRVPLVTPHLETNVWTCNRLLGTGAVEVVGNELRARS